MFMEYARLIRVNRSDIENVEIEKLHAPVVGNRSLLKFAPAHCLVDCVIRARVGFPSRTSVSLSVV